MSADLPGKSAVEQIVEAQNGFVLALALKLAPAPGMAEDISQQVFLEFLSKAERFDLASDPKPLLAAMTRHVARRLWQERTRSHAPELRQLMEYIRNLAEGEQMSPYSDEDRQALKDCLDKLPDKGRKIVEVHYGLGVSSAEIARRMEMEPGAVRQALFRLRAQLKECMKARTSGGLHYA